LNGRRRKRLLLVNGQKGKLRELKSNSAAAESGPAADLSWFVKEHLNNPPSIHPFIRPVLYLVSSKIKHGRAMELLSTEQSIDLKEQAAEICT
jgi:hypothetical protein